MEDLLNKLIEQQRANHRVMRGINSKLGWILALIMLAFLMSAFTVIGSLFALVG